MKLKKISKEEYIKTFCRDQRIRSRKTIYVSTVTHDKLRKLATSLRTTYTTTASLVDTILTQHLEAYREPIEEIVVESEPALRKSHQFTSNKLDDMFKR